MLVKYLWSVAMKRTFGVCSYFILLVTFHANISCKNTHPEKVKTAQSHWWFVGVVFEFHISHQISRAPSCITFSFEIQNFDRTNQASEQREPNIWTWHTRLFLIMNLCTFTIPLDSAVNLMETTTDLICRNFERVILYKGDVGNCLRFVAWSVQLSTSIAVYEILSVRDLFLKGW